MSKGIPIIVVILLSILLSSCWTGLHYEIRSVPSLVEQPNSKEGTLGPPFTFGGNTLSTDGIHWHIWLTNIKVLKSYSTALVVPIKTFDTKSDESGQAKGYIGVKPFEMEISFLTDEGAVFSPWETSLYFDNNSDPVYPVSIYSGNSLQCGERIPGVPATARNRVERDRDVQLISAVSLNENKRDYVAHWTCLRLLFDTATPDPLQRFRLRLGNIVLPSGKYLRPMIYFSPVVNTIQEH